MSVARGTLWKVCCWAMKVASKGFTGWLWIVPVVQSQVKSVSPQALGKPGSER